MHTFIIDKKSLYNNKAIFKVVSEIFFYYEDSIEDNIKIKFIKDIDDINPLFLILLFALKKDKKPYFLLDLRELSEIVQHGIQHYLRQFIDLDNIEIIKIEPDIIGKDSIITNKKSYAIGFKSGKFYHYLPIMKLRGLPYIAPKWDDEYLYERDLKADKKRIAFYSRVVLHEDNLKDLQKYKDVLMQTVTDFLRYLNLKKFNLAEPLSIIFYELIDNIRKHTSNDTDGFFSFSRHEREDKFGKYNEYKLIIADNGKEGILNEYKHELEKEKKNIEKLNLSKDEKDFLNEYDKVIQKLNTKNTFEDDKEVLNSLFTLSSIITAHQIPRLMMHFGIPMLLQMLKIFQKGATNNILEIFTHRDERYYHIYYDKNKKYHINSRDRDSIKGTYFVLTFTDRIQSSNKKNTIPNIVSKIKNQDYIDIIKNYNDYINNTNKFQLISSLSEIPEETKNIIVDALKIETKSFGQFIREIYLIANQYELKDIIIINLNLQEIYPYLQFLSKIIYETGKSYEKSFNILFYDKLSPGVIFLGGKTKKEFLCIAKSLKNHYDIDTTLGLIDNNLDCNNDVNIDTNLFLDNILIPFELFPINDKELNNTIIFQSIINNYISCEKTKSDIHIDTQEGIHIDYFIDFRSIFEDSRWVKRLAFLLAVKLKETYKEKKLYLIGTDIYSNMLLSLTEIFLDHFTKNIIQGYKICNIYKKDSYSKIYKIIEQQKEFNIILISSVQREGKKIKYLKKQFINKDISIKAIAIIKSYFDKKQNQISFNEKEYSLINVYGNGEHYSIQKEVYCSFCENNRDIPLIELDKTDPFLLKDTFFKKIDVEFVNKNKNQDIYWKKSLYFGHIERGNNHFLYYIDTIEFFKNNLANIESYLSNISSEYKNIDNVLILAPSHDTNNNFINLVNKIVFNSEATILHFDKTKGEDNLYRLSTYKFDWKITKVFFVDDSISSGYTLEYFYTILQHMKNYPNNNKDDGFDGVFIMIDRADSVDKKIIKNYLKKNSKINAFAMYHIKPIKTEVEECFLCKRAEEYLDLMTKSALDLTIFQMANKALKIQKINYKDIEKNSKNDNFESRLKAYIKALAIDFVAINFDIEQQSIKSLIKKFSNHVFKLFEKENQEFINNIGEEFIKQVIKFESEIALLKAMSFPKLSYQYYIRKKVVQYIVRYINKQIQKNEEEFKNFIVEKIINIALRDNQKFVNTTYKHKTNMHRLNAYFSILGYFKDPILLRKEYIKLYYLAIDKKAEFSDKRVLHTYHFAVKMTISDSEEKSNFFENNLIDFFKDQKRNKYKFGDMKWTLVDALYLENTLFDRNQFIQTIEQNDNQKTRVKDFFNYLKINNGTEQHFNKLKEKIQDFIEDISSIKLFVFPESNNKFENYESFLTKAKDNLIDVFNNYENLNVFENSESKVAQKIKELFCGMDDNNDKIKFTGIANIKEKIDDTWANYYQNGYTIVRLVKVDKSKLFSIEINRKNYKRNSNLWFKPIGCMILKHDKEDDHLKIVRKILAIRYELVEFIVGELGYGGIQEAIQNKEYESLFSTFNHEVAPLFEIHSLISKIENDEDKRKLKNYTLFMQEIVKIGRFKKNDNIEKIEGGYSFKEVYETYSDIINDFMEIGIGIIKKFKKIQINFIESEAVEKFKIPISSEYIKPLFYELIFNVMKNIDSNENALDIKVEKDTLILKNKIDKSIKNTKKGDGIALLHLKSMLSKIDYHLNWYDENDTFYVNIKQEERKK